MAVTWSDIGALAKWAVYLAIFGRITYSMFTAKKPEKPPLEQQPTEDDKDKIELS